jgi:hypothetical protein
MFRPIPFHRSYFEIELEIPRDILISHLLYSGPWRHTVWCCTIEVVCMMTMR